MLQLSCPSCKRTVEWNSAARWRPFCSDRCRLIDLGEWLAEKHAIPGEPATDAAASDDDAAHTAGGTDPGAGRR